MATRRYHLKIKSIKGQYRPMKSIEDHIKKDKDIIDDPLANPAARRHAKEELHELEEYVEHHKDEIAAGDHHDPNALELFCDMHPDEPECLVYDD